MCHYQNRMVASFDLIIFATALYALTTEIIEDSFVLMIYQMTFGKKNLIYGLVIASVTVAFIMMLVVLYGIPSLELYSKYVITGSGLFLVGLGSYWIIKFWLVKLGIREEESESANMSVSKSLASFTMIFVELLEILAILVPFVLTKHIAETTLSIVVSIGISLGLISVIGTRLRKKLENKLTSVKLFAGMALIFSGIVIIFNLK